MSDDSYEILAHALDRLPNGYPGRPPTSKSAF